MARHVISVLWVLVSVAVFIGVTGPSHLGFFGRISWVLREAWESPFVRVFTLMAVVVAGLLVINKR